MRNPRKHLRTALALAALLSVPFHAAAKEDHTTTQASIRVTGEGSVSVAPDMAVLTLSVVQEAKTAGEALDANSAAMSRILAAMGEADIASRDLQTSGFSIQPKMIYPRQNAGGERPEPHIVGYTVRNSLTVRVRDLANVGAIIDKSVSLGVNQGGNIRLVNDDPSAALTEARTLAVADALARAKTLASAAGVRVGQLLEMTEQSRSHGPVPIARAEMLMADSASNAVPVASGENTYSVQVSLSFAIEQ